MIYTLCSTGRVQTWWGPRQHYIFKTLNNYSTSHHTLTKHVSRDLYYVLKITIDHIHHTIIRYSPTHWTKVHY